MITLLRKYGRGCFTVNKGETPWYGAFRRMRGLLNMHEILQREGKRKPARLSVPALGFWNYSSFFASAMILAWLALGTSS